MIGDSDPSLLPGFRSDHIVIWAKSKGRGNFKWFKLYEGQYFFPFHVPWNPNFSYRVEMAYRKPSKEGFRA